MTKKQKLIKELENKISKTHELIDMVPYNFYRKEKEIFMFSENAVDYAPNATDYRPLTINDIKIMVSK